MTAAEDELFRLAAEVAAARGQSADLPVAASAAVSRPLPASSPTGRRQSVAPDPAPILEMATLATSSKGNATLVRAGNTAVLVDAGISARRLTQGLRGLGVDPAALSGILLTHEHSDHVAGLARFLKQYDVPVYANQATWQALGEVGVTYARRRIPLAAEMTVGSLRVGRFPTTHDAADPSGFTFCVGRVKGAVCTDLGEVTSAVAAALSETDMLVLEANHDPEMLYNGPYAAYLKRRIAGPQGHLANAQAGQLLAHLYRGRSMQLIWAHRSATNNHVTKVEDAIVGALARNDISIAREAIRWQHGDPAATVRMCVTERIKENQ